MTTTYPENPIEYKKFNKIAELSCKINVFNRVIEMLEATKEVLKKFDSKVINKKLPDAVTEAFQQKWPRENGNNYTKKFYHCGIGINQYQWKNPDKEMSMWATDTELTTWKNSDGENDYNSVSFNDVYPMKFRLWVSEEFTKSDRLDYSKTVEEIDNNICILTNTRNKYQDAIDNYDKYWKMNHEIEIAIKNYQQNINREIGIERVIGLYI